MRRKSRDEIDALKEAVPVELLLDYLGGEVVRVTHDGKTQVRCPFHGDDAHPSAVIFTDGEYFCSACDVQGDLFTLVQRAGLADNFMEAFTWVEENMMPGVSITGSS